ncbi:MAG: hypothetical protein M3077_05130 [Candidatus Dormibacteraeota bacterium]|nr:hypothetical protein [Candidatus Dormibacteraeota bacterium]
MNGLVWAIWAGAAVQMVIAGANLVVARRLDYRGNVARLSPIVREVFIVHAAYIVLVILWFSLLCILFATELASGKALGRFLSGGLATFWGLRGVIQLTMYDRNVRKRNRREDLAFLLACASLTAIFLLAAVHP